MKSIFDAVHNKELVERIAILKADSPAQWGSMNAAQMLAHCEQALRTAFGDLKLPRRFIGMLLGNWAKKRLLTNDKAFDRNMPTDKAFVMKETYDFAEKQRAVIELVERFVKQGRSVLTTEPHPFFGSMTVEQWDVLHVKHLDHHLRQFGV